MMRESDRVRGENEREGMCESVEGYRNSVGVVFLQKLEEGSVNEWEYERNFTCEILPIYLITT